MDYGLLLTLGLVVLGAGVLIHLGYSWRHAVDRYQELKNVTNQDADLRGYLTFGIS